MNTLSRLFFLLTSLFVFIFSTGELQIASGMLFFIVLGTNFTVTPRRGVCIVLTLILTTAYYTMWN